MTLIYLMAPALSILLLIGHFLRGDNFLAALFSLFVFFVLFVRRSWAARTLQVYLLLGSMEWGRTAVSLIADRVESGEPFIRLAIILGGVFLLTVCSLLVFRTAMTKTYFGLS